MQESLVLASSFTQEIQSNAVRDSTIEQTATQERRGAMQKLLSPAEGLEENMINTQHQYAR
jgi:hypothetical protein